MHLYVLCYIAFIYTMATHNLTGKKGEELAAAWLLAAGFTLLHKNWRHTYWEVDIIAHKNNILHFIEVKTLRSNHYGHPEQKVGTKKIRHLLNAAEQYVVQQPQWQRIQIDVLSIVIAKGAAPTYFFIEDVYL